MKMTVGSRTKEKEMTTIIGVTTIVTTVVTTIVATNQITSSIHQFNQYTVYTSGYTIRDRTHISITIIVDSITISLSNVMNQYSESEDDKAMPSDVDRSLCLIQMETSTSLRMYSMSRTLTSRYYLSPRPFDKVLYQHSSQTANSYCQPAPTTSYFKATQSTISSMYTKPRHLILPMLSPHAPKNAKLWLMNKTSMKSIQRKIGISTKMSQSENAICHLHRQSLLKNAQEPKNSLTGTSDLVMRLIAPFSVSLDLISKSMKNDAKPVCLQKRLDLRFQLALKRLLRNSNSSIPISAAQTLSPSAEAFTSLRSSMISAATAGSILFSAKARLPYWSHSSSLSRMQKTRPNARSKPFGLMAEANMKKRLPHTCELLA